MSETETSRVLAGSGYKRALGTLFAVMTVLAATPLVAPGAVTGPVRWFLGAPCLGLAIFTIRWWRAKVVVSRAELVLMTPFRTHRLPWKDVRESRVAPTNANRLFGCVLVITTQGQRIKVDGVASRWKSPHADTDPVAQTVAMINKYAGS